MEARQADREVKKDGAKPDGNGNQGPFQHALRDQKNGPDNRHDANEHNQLEETDAIFDLLIGAINSKVSETKGYQHVPIGDPPEGPAAKCDAVPLNCYAPRLLLAQAIREMYGQLRQIDVVRNV